MKAGSRLRHGSIQWRIISLSLAFTLLVSVVIAVVNVQSLQSELRRTTLQNAEYALQTAASTIRSNVDEVDTLLNWCSYNAEVRTWLLTEVGGRNPSLSAYNTVSARYGAMRTALYIQHFLLINASGRRILFGTAATNTVALTDETLARISGWTNGNADWSSVGTNPLMLSTQAQLSIPLTRTLEYNGRTARLLFEISPALITDPLKSFTLPDEAYLLWQMNGTLYTVSGGTLTEYASPEDAEPVPLKDTMLDPDTEVYRAADSNDLIVRYPIGVHDLYLIEVIPAASVQQSGMLLTEPLAVTLLGVLFLGAALMWRLHRMVARPIGILQRRIERIGEGDFTPDPATEWDNELGDIGRGINQMSVRVTSLIDTQLADAKAKQDLEYRMLQNQVNPHFIYNTLNSIKWMAAIQHAPGIAEMVTALSRLLKSVSKGNERLVPLQDEFALLNDYFTIQQYRYGGTITLDVTYIEDERLCRDCLIPRFTLQPLVENAIFHGIEPKGCAGSIAITVRQDAANGDVLIALTDDGVGMTPEQLAKALQEPSPEEAAAKFRHVGLWNVHRRIQYSFGEAYGLSLCAEVGRGTTVTVRLPGKNQGKAS